ncbi:hypothetical protein SDC9_93490 [bioreactor metagenome]|uniref:Uncharacterized protein n=1 Tax=bioreactor metagenome TaxID=1076179 RepID=A0A645AAS3_9ZZZZ
MNFHCQTALPGNHIAIIERFNESQLVFFCIAMGSFIRLVESISDQFDFNIILSEITDLVNFLGRGCRWHEDGRFDTQMVAGIGYSLGMIAGGGTDYPGLSFGFAQLRNGIISTPQFEGADDLKVLPLQKDVGMILLR